MATEVVVPDAFPTLLLQHAKQRGTQSAIREKSRGIWRTTSWQALADEAGALAAALSAQGLQRGAHVALIGDNRPHLYTFICAVHRLGAIAVPLPQDATAEALHGFVQSLDIAHVFAEDQEQVDKLLAILPDCPGIRCVVYDNDRGMRHYKQPQLHSYAALLAQGRAATIPEALDAQADDVAFVFVSSSTQARSYTHAALIASARSVAASDTLHEGDVTVACLPPTWVEQMLFSYAQPMAIGNCICCPESSETLLSDMREMGPSYLLAPVGALQSMHADAQSRMADAGGLKRSLYQRHMANPAASASAIGALLIATPLSDVLGMRRVRAAYVAGALDADSKAFFRRIGIELKALPQATAGSELALRAPTSSAVNAAAASHHGNPVTRPFAIGKPILELDSISLRFGGVNALTNISFNIREHEVLAIIGPNGAGKSSMLNVINGVYRPQEGNITLRGERLNGMTPTRAARMGISRTFQNIALFKGMTVLDNIMAGRTLRMHASFLEVALQLPRARREERENREKVEEIIEFLEIEHIRKTPVARLPYGLQKRVELGRALAAEPKILLLDEPMAGMNIEEKQDMSRFILDVNDHYGTTVVLIEHDMGVVMDISDRVVVLDYGKKIGDGTPAEVRANPDVINAYLGVGH